MISDDYAVPVAAADFASGGLRHDSNVRPNRLFTADSHSVLYRAGSLQPVKVAEVVAKIVQILNA